MTQPKPEPMVTVSGWLVLDQNGIVKANKKHLPSLDFGQIMCRLKITIPRAIFTRPTLSASVRFDGPVTHELSEEVAESVDRVLKDAGFTVNVQAVELDHDQD